MYRDVLRPVWRASSSFAASAKLARTFAAQVEALKRYRSSGEQTMRVEHVTVNNGGQAIVGNVASGAGPSQKSEDPPYALGYATGAALPPTFGDPRDGRLDD